MVNKRKHETTRLKLARAICSACSTIKMEKDKYAPFPLAQFLECHNQSAWIAVVNSWIRKPAVLEKYLEIAHDIVFYMHQRVRQQRRHARQSWIGYAASNTAVRATQAIWPSWISACTEVSTFV